MTKPIDWTKPIRVRGPDSLTPARLLADNRCNSDGCSHLIMDNDGEVYVANEYGHCNDGLRSVVENVPEEYTGYLAILPNRDALSWLLYCTEDVVLKHRSRGYVIVKVTVCGDRVSAEFLKEGEQ